MKFYFTLSFILIVQIIYARSLKFPFGAVKSMELVTVNKKPTIYFFLDHYYVKYDVIGNKFNDSVSYLNSSVEVQNILNSYISVTSDSCIYFIQNEGGLLYVFNDGFFKRIDHSFEHKMQINSSIFCYKNRIYRYGGYGFFTCRNFFTYFDFSTHEWEVLTPIKNTNLPEGTSSNLFFRKDSIVYLFDGNIQNQFNLIESTPYNQCWKFDLKKRLWSNLGDLTETSKNEWKCLDKNGNLYSDASKNEIITIDAEKNEVLHYRRNLTMSKLDNLIHYNDKYYCLLDSRSQEQSELYIYTKAELLGVFLYKTELYKTNHVLQNVIITILFLGFIVAVYYLLKYLKAKKTKIDLINLNSDHLQFRDKKLYLEPLFIEVIRLLLNNKNGVTSAALMKITEKKGLDYTYNQKAASNIIKELNLVIKTFINSSDEIILQERSKDDSRIKVYIIKVNFFKI